MRGRRFVVARFAKPGQRSPLVGFEGAGLRRLSRRGSWVQIPPPAPTTRLILADFTSALFAGDGLAGSWTILGPSSQLVLEFPVSRLKRPRPYLVIFLWVISCLVGRMGDFSLTGRNMGESRSFETVGSLAFSFRPSRRSLPVVDRFRFRAYSGRFLPRLACYELVSHSATSTESPGVKPGLVDSRKRE